MNNGNEVRCFLRLLQMLLDDDNNYLLPIKEYKNVRPVKKLLGYYNRDYIYFIPSVVVGMCDTILIQNKLKPLNMQKTLKQLFALDMIKVHWVLTDEVEIGGFGAFAVVTDLNSERIPVFKAGKALRNVLNTCATGGKTDIDCKEGK